MNTIITELTDNGEVSYDVFSKLVDNRILFLYNHIDDDIAADIVAALLYLDHNCEDIEKKISLYINSESGDIRSIFMIYDMMRMIKSPIETFCIGSAAGEPALILAAGTKGMRFATKNSIIKLGQLTHCRSIHSDIMNAEILLDQLKKDNIKYLEAMHECTGKSLKTLTKDSEKDFYMTADIAKKYGFIDAIIGDFVK